MNSYSLMFRLVFSFYLFLASASVFAQGEANVWYFGTRGGLDFNSGTPVKLSNSLMNLTNKNGEGMASICDAAGNILFYTDGINVYRGDHSGTMTNGTGIAGNTSSAQTALIIPVPGKTNLYYLFSTPGVEQSTVSGDGVANGYSGLRYSIVNTTTNTVTNKNTLLTPSGVPVTEGQTAVPHYDGTSFWLICREAGNSSTGAGSNNFYAYRIGTDNINATTGVINSLNGTADEVISPAGTAIPGITGAPGVASTNGIITIKANSCFNKLAVAYFAIGAIGKRVEVFNFNNNTGVIGLANTITNFDAGDPNEIYGLEFSPNGNLLYTTVMNYHSASVGVYGSLYQFDISSGVDGTINAAAQRFKSNVTTAQSRGLGALQLAPDGKIYYVYVQNDPLGSGAPDPSYVGRITNPDVKGTGAGFNHTYISFTNAANSGVAVKMGLPQVYRGFLASNANITSTLSNLQEICLGENVDFTATSIVPIVSYQWNIDKNLNSTIDYTTGPTINHTYTVAGDYTVEVEVTDACGYSSTSESMVKVLPVVNSAGSISCNPVRGTVTSPNAAYTYVWYSDAAATNAIATGTNPTLPVGGSGNVYVKATSGSSSSSTSLSNGTATGHPWSGSDAGTTHTMGFTVNKGPLTFGSFEWEAPYGAYAASNQNTTFTVELRNSGGTVVYTNTRTVATNGPTWVNGYPFTETVNQVLPIGTYSIVITATSGVGGPIKRTSPCTSNQADTESALTYATSGVCGFAAAFSYSLTEYSTTALACSQVSSAIAYNCPLPVTWVSFGAKRAGNTSVDLTWSTAMEENTKVYEVQRSLDGMHFETIGTVDAAGFSHAIRNYTYTDGEAPTGNVYYRILQIDIDAQFSYSKLAFVNGTHILDLTLLPNPGSGSFTITGVSGDVSLDVTVYTITGQAVFRERTAPGQTVDLQGLSKGLYLVKVIAGNSEQTIRYINQ